MSSSVAGGRSEKEEDAMDYFSAMTNSLQILHDAINALSLDKEFIVSRLDFEIEAAQCSEDRPKGPHRKRTFFVTLSGEAARRWIEKPNWDDIWRAYGCYFFIGGEDDEALPNDSLVKYPTPKGRGLRRTG
jgi:hypothetical protein